MGELISHGYCQALLAGNALATHDLEGGYLRTALGCDIINQKQHFMGHYNHLDTINAIDVYKRQVRGRYGLYLTDEALRMMENDQK